MPRFFDVAVIGQGYAGLCAARDARARGLRVVAFEGVMVGGAVMTVLQLRPSPETIASAGPDLCALIGMDNIDAGVRIVLAPATRLAPTPDGCWEVDWPEGKLCARHIILATGTRPRRLGVLDEDSWQGRGLSRCADCDGPDMSGRDCVVVGGGDAAFQEAAILARFARSVTIVMRAEQPRARSDLVAAALCEPNVHLLERRQIARIEGGDRINGVWLSSGDFLRCEGLFPFIGGIADTTLVPDDVRDDEGALMVDGDGLVRNGLWAIGSVRAGFTGGLGQAREDALRAVRALGR